MEKKFDTGGPAFPQYNTTTTFDGQVITNIIKGMTLWDYFAAHAPYHRFGMPLYALSMPT